MAGLLSLDRLQHFCCTQSYVSLKYVFLSVYISWHTYLVTIWKKANESLEATYYQGDGEGRDSWYETSKAGPL